MNRAAHRAIGNIGIMMACALVGSGRSATPATPPTSQPGAGKVVITQEKDDLKIEIDGTLFTRYRFQAAADDPKWQRPYFWPVRLADGTEVTSDQMREFDKDPKADHPHQRSIWVGWGDVNGANHWTQSAQQQRHVQFSKVEGDTFVEELTWDATAAAGGAAKPVLTEKRTVKVIAYTDGARGLEITSALTAANGAAQFKCKALNVSGVEAGLCSLRMSKAILDQPDASKWITTSAATGEAESRVKPASWCDYSGLIHGEKYGAAIVNAADNPGGDTAWHVRLFGLLAHIGPLNWTLDAGKTVTYRHLVIVHVGDAAAARIDEKAQAWRAK